MTVRPSALRVTASPSLQATGGAIGAGVSGVFLWVIGVLNLLVLVDVIQDRPGAAASRVTLGIGTVELLQVLADRLGLDGGFRGWLGRLDSETLGYAIVGLFRSSGPARSRFGRCGGSRSAGGSGSRGRPSPGGP